ncbi:MAG: MFS transporter, partial [Pseudomonadota bacterium]
AGWTGAVAFLNFAPTLISGPLFGVAADRSDPRLGMMATQSGQALCAAVLAALAASGLLTLTALAALALASGVAASAYHPMRMSLAPRLVPKADLPQAVAMTALNFNATRMIGPALGGWLIAGQGAAAATTLATLCFAPQVAALLRIPAQPPDRAARSAAGGLAGFAQELRGGGAFVLDRPMLREAFYVSFFFSFAGRGILEILPAAADGLYGRGAAGLGLLTAAAGGGAVLSSLWLAKGARDAAQMRRRALTAAVCGQMLVLSLALIESWPATLLAVAGLGAAGTVVGVSSQSLTQTGTPDGTRGRVMSLWILMGIGGAALGALGLGALADQVGLRAALGAGAALALIALLLRPRPS